MKMKRFLAILSAAALCLSIFAACGGSSPAAGESAPAAPAQDSGAAAAPADTPAAAEGAIRLLNGKIEIDGALKGFAEGYQERTGQEVVIESLGGGMDIFAQIMSYNAAGNMPDIFKTVPEGIFAELELDLTGQPWLDYTDMALVRDGKVVGAPYAIEGIGLIYNAEILEKAGIDPDTLTNVAAQRAAFEKLDGMKEELGLQAVISAAAESGNMGWATGLHLMSSYLAMGVDRSDKRIINLLNAGELDTERFSKFADYIEILFSYADQNVLLSGNYDDQVGLYAQGKTAFLCQGNWVDPSLEAHGVTFRSGLLPYAFLDNDTPGMTADPPDFWAVHNGGSNIDAALAFLADILIGEEGQRMFVQDAGAISVFSNCPYIPEMPISAELFVKSQNYPTYAWDWLLFQEALALDVTGKVFELFAKGDIDKQQFIDMMASEINIFMNQ
ncbi:MAG: extracellular solute-binding protein [Oscillospiraceae bacterium]|nr:extracellular solute-binding protein [Oscillospiraceae bacterium]